MQSLHHHPQDHEHKDHANDETKDLGPYWKRVHKDWRFWVGVVILTVAITIYVMTFDLSMVPR